MNATEADLARLQKQIAAGIRPTLSEGKTDEFCWHPTMSGFGLRVYANGSGTWLVQYRNGRGLQRRHKLGSAAAITLKQATSLATIIFGDIARGLDPQGQREEARDKPKCTLGAMVERFLDEGKGVRGKKLSPHTHYVYANVAKNHLGGLARMQIDAIEKRHVHDKIKEVEKAVSPHAATHVRALMSTVYKWGTTRGLISVPNPVQDTYRPELPESAARSLSLAELGAIWRACETLSTSPLCYRGNGNGRPIASPANSVRADGTMLTTIEAARQFGLPKNIVWRAIGTGALKAQSRGDFPKDHPANRPAKLKQGQGHSRDYLIEAAEMERFANSRLSLMRSAEVENAAIVRLLMLLGGRYGEIGALRWSEVDLDKGVLHIKGQRTAERRGTKNSHDLRLPLSPMAIAIIEEFQRRPGRDLIFGIGPHGLRGNGIQKRHLDARIADLEGQPLKPWRNHDLRHSLSTHMNEMGIDTRVVETIVNHYSGHRRGIAGRYNHAKYEGHVKQALDAWERAIRLAADGIIETEAPNVVAFGKQSA